MTNINIVKCTFTAMLISISIALTTISSGSDEPADTKQPKASNKYSTFFEKKEKWCDALVITCTDFRFTTATQKFINDKLQLKDNYDYISIPGSIRNLIDSKTRDIVLNTFGVSVHLHHVNRVIIFTHQDCSSGYGGSKSFSDPVEEFKTIYSDLKKARKLMQKKYPHLKVYLYYATVLFKNHHRIYNFKQIL